MLKRRNGKFGRVQINTGADRGSTLEEKQYLPNRSSIGREPDTNPRSGAEYHIGVGSSRSKGTAKITFQIGDMRFDFKVYAVEKNVPILVSIDYLDRVRVLYDNLTEWLIHFGLGSIAILLVLADIHICSGKGRSTQTIHMQSFAVYIVCLDIRM